VTGAPILPEVAETLLAWLNGQVVVCHTLFDKRALTRAFDKYGLTGLNCRWLDSCQVARQTWNSPGGYSLAVICGLIGHEFKHHDALEDAKAAAALILTAERLAAERKTGITPVAG
jgi:DNA polymerase-3 subunit epsilon